MDSNTKEEKIVDIFDIRMLRPLAVLIKKTNKVISFQQIENIKIENKKVSFKKPNNIAIFASIAHREKNIAKELYDKNITPCLLTDNFNINDQISILYDYFEHVQSAIISIYTAIESLSNIAIPRDYLLEKFNNRKVKEVWTKDNIERWLTTSEKIGDIVPAILKIDSPKKYKIWTLFKELESIRNDIIHQKSEEDPNKLDSKFLGKLLRKKIFDIIDSGFGIIKYFCDRNKSHGLFPYGFSKIEIKPFQIDTFEDYFEEINDEE